MITDGYMKIIKFIGIITIIRVWAYAPDRLPAGKSSGEGEGIYGNS